MNTESDKKNKLLATISLILGILSFGLFILASLSSIWIKLAHFDGYQALFSYIYLVLLTLLGSLILGITGCMIALVALIRIRKEAIHSKTLRTVIISLFLGGLGPAFVLIFLAFVMFFGSSTTPPHPPTGNTWILISLH